MTEATDAEPARPALRYFGGKWRLATWIASHLAPHTAYVEPFCGAASVYLKKSRSEFSVLNDVDGEVVNFFSILRDETEAFVRAVNLTPYSRDEYDRAWEPSDDPLERARRFYIRSHQSHGGPSTAWRGGWRVRRPVTDQTAIVGEWNNTDHLWAVAERLKWAEIENRDWCKVVEFYDAPETLFYLDPPYPRATRKAHRCGRYRHDFDSQEDHAELASVLRNLRGMVAISGYPSPLYDELYAGWECRTTHAATDSRETVTECLWLSPAASAGLARGQQSLPMED